MDSASPRSSREPAAGRLHFRPRPSTGTSAGREVSLGLGRERDGVLYVPDTAERGAPVMLLFHGGGGTGRHALRTVLSAADRYGVVVAAPDARAETWDVIASGSAGPDADVAGQVLDRVADTCDVDFDRLAAGGMSDGASYALSIGVTNGDAFSSIVAFSPGFVSTPAIVGRPRVFISHGTHDRVLPIDLCGRRLAAGLSSDGYPVTFHEFDGGHSVPPEVVGVGFRWWLQRSSAFDGILARPAEPGDPGPQARGPTP
ncbi:MAG TPA: alpha/beta hydrolase-fold protein [Acidimicrobiales bacterium]